MTNEFIQSQKVKLLALKITLENSLGLKGVKEEMHIEAHADSLDMGTALSQIDTVAREINHKTGLLRKVKIALLEIQEGGYGVCIDCADSISQPRLMAVPWTNRCRECQEVEEGEKTGPVGRKSKAYGDSDLNAWAKECTGVYWGRNGRL